MSNNKWNKNESSAADQILLSLKYEDSDNEYSYNKICVQKQHLFRFLW